MIFAKKIFNTSLFVAFYLLISHSANHGWYFVAIGIAALNIALFFVNMRIGIMMFIPFVLLSEWSSRIDIRAISGLASIHAIYLGPFNLFTYMLIFFAAIILLRKGIRFGQGDITVFERSSFFVMGTFLVIALSGIGNIRYHPRQYISDLAPLMNMVCGFVLVGFLFVKPNHIYRLIWVLIYCFAARAIIGVVWFVVGSGYSLGGSALLPFYDPVGAFTVFLFSMTASMMIFSKTSLSERAFLFLVMLSGMAFFFMWPSRAQFIVMLSGVFFVSLSISTKKKISYGLLLVAMGLGLFVLLNNIVPGIIGYAVWKISTFGDIGQGLLAPATIAQRLVEAYNVIYKLWIERTILWGAGAGGWFDDRYFSFPVVWLSEQQQLSAFSKEQLFYWKFFKPHDTFLWILLKGGLLGLGLYFLFLVSFVKSTVKEIFKTKKTYIKIVLVGLTVPFISTFLGFSAKNFVVSGILFAIMANVIRNENTGNAVFIEERVV